ncbi:MAG: hypothetical protein ACRC54_05130 [Fusobacteriaceae bacterium]
MKELNITQAGLARILGQKRGTINTHLRLWNAGKTPSIKILKQWADALKISYKEFLPFL